MKVLMINVSCGTGSTGRICTDLADALIEQGHQVKVAYGRDKVPEQYLNIAYRIGNDFDVYMHALESRIFDNVGFGSRKVTENFIEWIKVYDPDVIHIHNVHGYYVNVELLFKYLKTCGKKIIWTLHDCWAFTGHCAYFDYVGCEKWKIGCEKCSVKDQYPARWFIDNSKNNFAKKKDLFCNVPNLTIVTPSRWLAKLLSNSYLKEYPVAVINNGINTNIFKPTPSNIKERLNIVGKKIILGVASVWDRRKGLDVFIKLSGMIDDDYKIVLVGLRKNQINELPKEILGITRTENIQQLVEIYSAADVFINPTFEDNYPTTNLEAIACGTPVITFDTGGSGESARLFGCIIDKDDLPKAVEKLRNKKLKNLSNIDSLDYRNSVLEYIRLYS